MEIFRWIKAWGAVALWGYLLAGAYGLVEGVYHLFKLSPESGLASYLVPHIVFYGWTGFVFAALLFLPATLLTLRDDVKWRRAFALALSAAISLLLTLVFRFILPLRIDFINELWVAHEWLWGLLIPLIAWLLGTIVLLNMMNLLAHKLTLSPRMSLIVPVVVMIVSTSLWPNWQTEQRDSRVGNLEVKVSEQIDQPNLILISIDTLRKDVLDKNFKTPAFDKFAQSGVTFANCWSTSCWTLPSMTTIHTGYAPGSMVLDKYTGLPADVTTLAEIAYANGYQTAAIASNPYLSNYYGFDRGFEWYDHSSVIEPFVPAKDVVLVRELLRQIEKNIDMDDGQLLYDKSVNWLLNKKDDRPLFFWIHMMDPHLPYRGVDVNGDRPLQLPDHQWLKDGQFKSVNKLRDALPDVSHDVKKAVIDLYNLEVEYSDYVFGNIIKGLQDSGLLENSIIVLVSDHGEELFDHGGFEHGHSFLPEVSAIPLVVRFPKGENAGSTIDSPVNLINFFTSICSELGWNYEAARPGNDGMFSAKPGAEDFFVLENVLYGENQYAAVCWPYLRIESDVISWYRIDQAEAVLSSAPDDSMSWLPRIAEWNSTMDEYEFINNLETTGPGEDIQRKLRSLGY
ncbi:MAG: sulfatase-like hydrolase/transferase [bacterium]|nr:sulfatase-like hydrolase/transferase [bacterium]